MFYFIKTAGKLTSPSNLRHQAIFMVGTGGSGKSFVANKRYLKYLPQGVSPKDVSVSEDVRYLTQLKFDNIKNELDKMGIDVLESGELGMPFILKDEYRNIIPPEKWREVLPKEAYEKLVSLKKIVFSSPKNEIPSLFRQVNSDVYKEELPGYDESRPGLVHEMSSKMADAYFEATIETGDPFIADGTGAYFQWTSLWMKRSIEKGYKVTFLYVRVPLIVSLIRNSLRARKVNPKIILNQFKELELNIPKYIKFLKSFPKNVARIKIIDNSSPTDLKNFLENCTQINDFFKKVTNDDSLYAYLKDEFPESLNATIGGRKWGEIIQACEVNN